MAIISRTPCAYSRPQPTRLRPMRRVRLLKADPLDRWLATVDFLDPVSPRPPLPVGEVRCAIYMVILEVIFFSFYANIGLIMFQGLYGTVCQLSMAVYDHVAGYTEALSLDRHVGLPTDADAPLWTRRLPPRKILRFSQPREFVARLVAGMSDIPVPAPSAKMLFWARDATIGTSTHRIIARRCKNIELRKIKVWSRGTNLRGL
ncbi:hypothetical protein B0H13DRAFT_2350312 [Mycena leptocephala]|nr:hypothetical protein B0H13DRAFT_2350312 [Mycena leptocephala]